MGWVTQSLTKVLPQPDDKYREVNDGNQEEVTEVRYKSALELFNIVSETSKINTSYMGLCKFQNN